MDFRSISISVILSMIFFYVNRRNITLSKSFSLEEKYVKLTKHMPSRSFLSLDQLHKLRGAFVIVAFSICVFIFYENEDIAVTLIVLTFIINLSRKLRK